MNQDQKLYGSDGAEHVYDDIWTVIEDIVDGAAEPGDTWEQSCDRISWPIEVCVYRRIPPMDFADAIAEKTLEYALEILDENMADPDGDPDDPTESMKAAAKEFAAKVCGEYVAWACEYTGEVVKVTKEEALKCS